MNSMSSMVAAQSLPAKPVYHISELFEPAGSRATAYRLMHGLQEAGFAEESPTERTLYDKIVYLPTIPDLVEPFAFAARTQKSKVLRESV